MDCKIRGTLAEQTIEKSGIRVEPGFFNTPGFLKDFGDWIDGDIENLSGALPRVNSDGSPAIYQNKAKTQLFYINSKNYKRPITEIKFHTLPIERRDMVSQAIVDEMLYELYNTVIIREDADNKKYLNIDKLVESDQTLGEFYDEFVEEILEEGVGEGVEESLRESKQDYLEALQQRLKSIGIVYKETPVEEAEDEEANTGTNPIKQKPSYQRRTQDKSSVLVKLMLETLPEYTYDGTDTVPNPILPTRSALLNPSKAWSILLATFADIPLEIEAATSADILNIEAYEATDMLEAYLSKLDMLALEHPWAETIYDILSRSDQSLQIDFFTAFNNNKNKIFTTTYTKGVGLTTMSTEDSGGDTRYILNEWALRSADALFPGGQLDEHAYDMFFGLVEEMTENVENFAKRNIDEDELDAKITELTNMIKPALAQVGVGVDAGMMRTAFYNLLEAQGIDADIPILFKKFAQSYAAKVSNLVNSNSSLEAKGLLKNNFKELAAAKAETQDNIADHMATVGKNRIYLYSLPTVIQEQINELKQNPSFVKELLQHPKFRNSLFLQSLQDPRNLKQLGIGLRGVLQEEGKSKRGMDNKSIGENDYLKVDIFNVLRTAGGVHTPLYNTQVPADKNREYMLMSKMFVETNTIREASEAFYGYAIDEYQEMIQAKNDVLAAIRKVQENNPGRVFSEEELLEEASQHLVIGYHLDNKGNLAVRDGDTMVFTGDAFKFKLFENGMKALDLGLIRGDGLPTASTVEQGDAAFADPANKDKILAMMDDAIQNIVDITRKDFENKGNELFVEEKTSKIIPLEDALSGDITSYYADKFKEFTHLANPMAEAVEAMFRDYAVNSMLAKVEYSKLFTGSIQYYKHGTDYVKRVPSTYIDGLQILTGLREGDATFKQITFKTEGMYQISELFHTNALSERARSYYEFIDRTDAQGWITPKRWRQIMIGTGKFGRPQQEVYDKLVKQWDYVQKNEAIPAELELTAKDIKLLSAQPIKGVYFKNDYQKGPLFLKYSQAVLIPSFVNNMPRAKQLLEFMEKNGIDEAVADTGVKVGATKPMSLDKFFAEPTPRKGTINVYYGRAETSGNTRILSNLAERHFEYKGRQYKSVEQAYQSLKSGKFDQVTYNKYESRGGFGTKIRGKAADFNTNLQLMRDLVRESFVQNPNSEAAKTLMKYEKFTHNNSKLDIDTAFIQGLYDAQSALDKGRAIDVQNSIRTLDNRNWRLQQDLPTKGIHPNKIGTQIQKIIVSRLRFMPQVLAGGKTGPQLADAIDKALGDLSDAGIQMFMRKYGIDSNYRITDIETFYESVLREMSQDGEVVSDTMNALKAEITTAALPGLSTKITASFLKANKKAATDLMTPGGAYIQISDHLIGKIEMEKKGVKMLTTVDRLKPPRVVKDGDRNIVMPGQVFIPHTMIAKFIPNYKEMSMKELNKLLPPEVKSMIGYRIPTQSRASTDILEVVGILPPEMGDSIITYGEITAKTGSDFDIDKMFFMLPELEVDLAESSYSNARKFLSYLNLSDAKMREVLMEEYDILEEDLQHERKDGTFEPLRGNALKNMFIKEVVFSDKQNEYKQHFKDFRFDNMKGLKLATRGLKGKRNKVFRLFAEALSEPQLFEALMTSIDNDITETSIMAFLPKEENYDLKVFSPINAINVRFAYKAGAAGIGEMVNANNDHTRSQNIGVTYDIGVGAWGNEAMDMESSKPLSDQEVADLLEYVNEFREAEGLEPLAVADIQSRIITDVLSELINAFVDIANKNAFITKAGWGSLMNSYGTMLIRSGVHPSKVFAIIMQPAVRELVFEISKSQGVIFNTSSAKVRSDIYKKYDQAANQAYEDGDVRVVRIEDMDFKTLLDIAKNGKAETFNELAHQVLILDHIDSTLNVTKRYTNTLTTSKTGENGAGKTIGAIRTLQNKLSNSLQTPADTREDYGFDNLVDKYYDKNGTGTLLMKFYANSVDLVSRIIENNPLLFYGLNKYNSDMINQIVVDNTNNPYLSNAQLADTIFDNVKSYLLSGFKPLNTTYSEERRAELMEKTFALKATGKYALLDKLYVDEEASGERVLVMNKVSTLPTREKNTLINSWKHLLDTVPEVGEFLVHEAYGTAGFKPGPRNFSELIPAMWLVEQGIEEYVRNTSDKMDKRVFEEQLFKNEIGREIFNKSVPVRQLGESGIYVSTMIDRKSVTELYRKNINAIPKYAMSASTDSSGEGSGLPMKLVGFHRFKSENDLGVVTTEYQAVYIDVDLVPKNKLYYNIDESAFAAVMDPNQKQAALETGWQNFMKKYKGTLIPLQAKDTKYRQRDLDIRDLVTEQALIKISNQVQADGTNNETHKDC